MSASSVYQTDREVDYVDAYVRSAGQAVSFGHEECTGMMLERNFMLQLQNTDDYMGSESAESLPTAADFLRKVEDVKSVDTNLSLISWFGPEEVNTTLQLGSSSCSGTSEQQGHSGSCGHGGCKKNTGPRPGDGKCQAEVGISPTQIVFKRKGHMPSLAVQMPTEKSATLGEGKESNYEPPKIGRVKYWHKMQGVEDTSAPTTLDAQDVVNGAEEGVVDMDNLLQHKLDVGLEYEVEQVIQNNVEICPLTQVERMWFEQVRSEVRSKLGDGYRITAADLRKDCVARARIRPVCDDRSGVTTDVFMTCGEAPKVEDEETESAFKPDGGN